ncbi:MAG: ABC transporter permease [Fimbriimonadaceae bacterium]|nr:ABC transporter permease [Fimbriimonadaceae bacterium]
MRSELRELWKYRDLLFVMVQREMRIRYKNSFLGVIWSFLNPLLQVVVMSFVFNTFVRLDVPNYTAYMLAAYLPYMFFQYCVLDSAQSILYQMPLLKKIYFPREILPLATVIANFIHLLLGFVILFGWLLFAYVRDPRVIPFQATTIYLPFLLLISLMLSTGVSFIVSALNTFYEDVKYIVQVLMYLMFYMCPVIYFAEQVANSPQNLERGFWLYRLYNLNPLAALSHGYRKILLAPVDVKIGGELAKAMPTPWNYIWLAFFTSLGVLIFGYWLFNRLKWKFVERP